MLTGPLRYGCVDGPPGKLDVYASICNATVAGIIWALRAGRPRQKPDAG
jgi:hypothetical protein